MDKIREALGLLNSMAEGREAHSDASRQAVAVALRQADHYEEAFSNALAKILDLTSKICDLKDSVRAAEQKHFDTLIGVKAAYNAGVGKSDAETLIHVTSMLRRLLEN